MNTLTLSPDLDPKEHSRKRYQARHTATQDHGTRGARHYKDGYGKTPDQLRDLDITSDMKIEADEHMRPAQLERAANMILRASGSEIDEALAMNAEHDAYLSEELATIDQYARVINMLVNSLDTMKQMTRMIPMRQKVFF